ncbi:MAG: CheB methylesterase domain-containing protein, partial [Pseudomonadota bacterium]
RRATPRPSPPAGAKEVVLRKINPVRPEVIAIGSSTGGPQALAQVLKDLDSQTRLPILIVQHMPKTFTGILAQHLSGVSQRKCLEGEDGAPIEAGCVYLAPGGRHMVVDNVGGRKIIRLNDEEPENFCRPAVDPLFRTVAHHYGPRSLAVVLTGMGQDGAAGGVAIADAGGAVFAQDKETSVVWGMPGATAWAGACAAVLPLPEIGSRMSAHCRGEYV